MHEITLPRPRDLRRFGLIAGAIVAVLFGALLPWLHSHPLPRWPWAVALALWIPALACSRALHAVYQAWMKIGAVLGFINTRLILGLFFYAVILPVGVLARLFGRDPMRRALDDSATYRIPSKASPPKHMERPF